MSNDSIIADVSLDQSRVALIEDGELVELYVEDEQHTSIVGNIYKGKVINVFPGMEAAFVDIGTEKNAFLHVGDAIIKDKGNSQNEEEITINDVVKTGQEILVQVIKEPLGTKGPRVTKNITLPGRYVVLMPNNDYVGVSRRIENENEREKLKNQILKVKPEGYGVIMRTAASGRIDTDFEEDINFLLKLWNQIKDKSEKFSSPKAIHREFSLIYRTVRDMFTYEVDKFIINDNEEYNKVVELVEMISPSLKPKVECYSKSYNIFEFYQIQSKITKALSKRVWLKSGGHIIIEQTEALTTIDVNTGKYVGNNNLEETILKINLEAAKEIAKQLRLRDIGGIIIIDFIDMKESKHQKEVLDELKKYLKKDTTKTYVVGISHLGLVEMTRKKIRQSLSSTLQTECPCCEGSGKIMSPATISKEIERQTEKLIFELMSNGVIIEAHPTVVKHLEEADSKIKSIKQKFDKRIIIRSTNSQNIEYFEVKDVDNMNFLC